MFTLNEWETQRPVLRDKLWRLLGDLPPRITPQVQIIQTIPREHYTIEKFTFDNGADATVYGYLLLPVKRESPAPAVLFHHYHAGHYHLGKNEAFMDRVQMPAVGPALAEAGYIVCAVDAYGFGERQNQGPGGDRESGVQVELALSKRFLWEGKTLWGMIVRDDLMALDYLCSRPEVDVTRIAATGMSMGSSRSTWVSALDDRIKVTIPVAQMTRYRDFMDSGSLNGHGIYYYVPGVLTSGLDMEHIASLTAPRAQFVLIGDHDPLSPFVGIQKVEAFTQSIYTLYGASAQYSVYVYPGVGHEYIPAMFTTLMEKLRLFL